MIHFKTIIIIYYINSVFLLFQTNMVTQQNISYLGILRKSHLQILGKSFEPQINSPMNLHFPQPNLSN